MDETKKLNEEFEAEQLSMGKEFFKVSGKIGIHSIYSGHWAKDINEAKEWGLRIGFTNVSVEVWQN